MTWTEDLQLESSHIDHLGHVTAVAYVVLFDEVRVRWLMRAWDTDEPDFVLATWTVDYLKEVRLADKTVRIAIDLRNVGRTSFEVHQAMSVGGEERARSTARMVAWDRGARRPRPLTDVEREAIETSRPSG